MAFSGRPYTGSGLLSRDQFIGEDPTLLWPITPTGLPVRAPKQQVHLKHDDVDNLPIQANFNCRMFSLCDPKDLEDFKQIHHKLVNRIYIQLHRENHWDEEQKHLRVWLEWAELCHVLPKQ